MSQNVVFNDYSKVKRLLPKKAQGINLIMYPIALEAWRRGIELSFYTMFVNSQTRIFYSLEKDDLKYNFQLSFGGVMDKNSRKIVNSKSITKDYLKEAKVPVPVGGKVSLKEGYEEAINFANTIGYPLVTKPLDAKNATGVFTNLKNSSELKKALVTSKNDFGYNEIMIEQYIRGKDTRVYVIEDKVIAAFERRPANVIGDGVSTIKELIDKKNNIRFNNPHLKRFMIEINEMTINYLKEQRLSLQSIPSKNERVFINNSTLHPDGCETVDVTEKLSTNIKNIAVNAVRAIPGMRISGVDIMIDYEKDEGYVLELNASPNISGHIFPMEGQSRDVPKAFIDHHFPETKIIGNNKYFSFDFDNIIKLLRNGTVAKVTVPPLPIKTTIAKEIIITGEIKNLVNWIHRRAMGKKLGGKFITIKEDYIKFKIAGEVVKVEEFIQLLLTKKSSLVRIAVADESIWKGLYPYYFRPALSKNTKENNKNLSLEKENDSLKKLLKDEKKKNQEIQNDLAKLNKELNEIKRSRSWKLTKPLRKLNSNFR